MKYRTPLHRRLKQAAQLKRRYWDDPAYRLHKVNSVRQRRGQPPVASVEHIRRARI